MHAHMVHPTHTSLAVLRDVDKLVTIMAWTPIHPIPHYTTLASIRFVSHTAHVLFQLLYTFCPHNGGCCGQCAVRHSHRGCRRLLHMHGRRRGPCLPTHTSVHSSTGWLHVRPESPPQLQTRASRSSIMLFETAIHVQIPVCAVAKRRCRAPRSDVHGAFRHVRLSAHACAR